MARPRPGPLRVPAWHKETRSRRENPETGPVVRRIFRLFTVEGSSLQAICDTLNAEGVKPPGAYGCRPDYPTGGCAWRVSTVYDIMREPTFLGMRVEDRSIATDEKKWAGGSRYVRKGVHVKKLTPVPDETVDALVDLATF